MANKPLAPASRAPPATREDLFRRLAALGIETETSCHAPLFTVAESKSLRGDIPGAHCKSLFLRDKKGVMWLVVALEDRGLDLRSLAALIGAARLSFASPARLRRRLGVEPGSVTPFALINDTGADEEPVRVVLDAEMMAAPVVNYHPLTNLATTSVAPADLLVFIADCGHNPEIVDLRPATKRG